MMKPKHWWWIIASMILLTGIILNYHTQSVPINIDNSTHDKTSHQVRILTYNLGLHNQYINEAKDSLDALTKLIDSVNADIVVLPESRMFGKQQLHQLLIASYPYHIGQQMPAKQKHIETWIYSRYPMSNTQRIGQHYIYSTEILLPDSIALTLVACHLSSNQWHSSLTGGDGLLKNIANGRKNRQEEVTDICEYLKGYDGHLVVCGDLNDMSGSDALDLLQNQLSIEDAWWTAGHGYGATFHGKGLYLRLDHILYSKHFTPTDINVINVDFSDHYPLVADLGY